MLTPMRLRIDLGEELVPKINECKQQLRQKNPQSYLTKTLSKSTNYILAVNALITKFIYKAFYSKCLGIVRRKPQ
jgi:hypothetical protein